MPEEIIYSHLGDLYGAKSLRELFLPLNPRFGTPFLNPFESRSQSAKALLAQHQTLLSRVSADLNEHLLLQGLSPAFDDVPLRRVFPLFLRTGDTVEAQDEQIGQALAQLVGGSGCELVQTFPILRGSKLIRLFLRTPDYVTSEELDGLELRVIEAASRAASESGARINIVNVNLAPQPAKSEGWATQLKDLTEALRNLLLIGVSFTLLLGGTIITAPRPAAEQPETKPAVVTVHKPTKNEHRRSIGKILEAKSPEEFVEALPQDRQPEEEAGPAHSGTQPVKSPKKKTAP